MYFLLEVIIGVGDLCGICRFICNGGGGGGV